MKRNKKTAYQQIMKNLVFMENNCNNIIIVVAINNIVLIQKAKMYDIYPCSFKVNKKVKRNLLLLFDANLFFMFWPLAFITKFLTITKSSHCILPHPHLKRSLKHFSVCLKKLLLLHKRNYYSYKYHITYSTTVYYVPISHTRPQYILFI